MTTAIMVLKLSSGEEILSEVDNSIEFSYLLINPMLIMQDYDDATGKMRMGFMPFMPYVDGPIGVPTNMAIVGTPTEQLENSYKERFGKIITPSTGKIFTGQ